MAEWDRQTDPEEPAIWFARFEEFRRQGPSRSMLSVYNAEREKDGKGSTTGLPQSWSESAKKWNWRARAEAWDAEQVRKARAVEADTIESRRKAWIEQARALQGVGVAALKKLHALMNTAGADPVLTARDILAFLGDGVKLELLARGEPTEHVEHSGNVTFERERAEVLGIVAALRNRAGSSAN